MKNRLPFVRVAFCPVFEANIIIQCYLLSYWLFTDPPPPGDDYPILRTNRIGLNCVKYLAELLYTIYRAPAADNRGRQLPDHGVVCLRTCVSSAEFLPARRYASAGLCDSDVSVCPSVRPSVTRRYCA